MRVGEGEKIRRKKKKEKNATNAIRLTGAINLEIVPRPAPIPPPSLSESDCAIELTNCRVDTCYVMRDFTVRLPVDPVPHPTPSSVFSRVGEVEGADLVWNRYCLCATRQ